MKSKFYISRALWPSVAIVLACNEPLQAPLETDGMQFTFSPTQLLGGGDVGVRSEGFRDLVLFPQRAQDGFFTRKNRWENLAVVFGEDTADVWRENDTTLMFTVPGLMAGEYSAKIIVEGVEYRGEPIQVAGVSRERWSAPTPRVRALGPGKAIGYHFYLGTLILELNNETYSFVPNLDFIRRESSGMLVPGYSYAPNQVLIDVRDPNSGPRGWRITPALTASDTVPCFDRQVWYYAAVHLAPGKCIGMWDLDWQPPIYINGTTTQIAPPNCGLAYGRFVTAQNGRWTVPITREDAAWRNCEEMRRWPVINDTPSVEYTIDRYSQVPGAAFSVGGDTLFLVGDTDFSMEENWVLDVLLTATGDVLSSTAIEATRLAAVMVDPIFSTLWVAGAGVDRRQMLLAFDRTDMSFLGKIGTPFPSWYEANGVLVHGGSSGAIFLVAENCTYCDVSITRFDIPAEFLPGL